MKQEIQEPFDLEVSKISIMKALTDNFKPREAWEEKHPFLATTLIMTKIIFTPINLLIISILLLVLSLL